ncbi:MAG TPA: hypothetical protein VIJ21_00745 [Solirubrobacterales bacterium]
MQRLGLALLLALALVAVAPRSARAANVRYAAPSGSGAQPCLESAPCSLEVALKGTGKDGVHEGDIVVVEPGTYHPGAGIAFEHVSAVGGEAGRPLPLIESAGSFGLEPGGDVDVHDLRINQPANEGDGLTLLNGSSAERVYVTNDEEGAGSGACHLFGTVALRDSLCENTAQGGEGTGITATTGSGSTSTATLDNVTAVGLVGISVRTTGGSDMTIDGTNVIASGSIDDLILRTDSSAGTSSTIKLSHSDFSTHAVEGTGNSFTSPSARQNQSAKPLFVNAAAGDFHEAPGSPTITTGDLSVVQPGDLDLDGASRAGPLTCGAAPTVDIGAYQSPPGECAPPSSAPTPPSSSPGPSPPSPVAPSPVAPRVRVSCPKGAAPTGCHFALQVFSAKPHRSKGGRAHSAKPVAESLVATANLRPGKSAEPTLTPKPKFATKLDAARSLLVRDAATIGGKRTVSYRRLKVVG